MNILTDVIRKVCERELLSFIFKKRTCIICLKQAAWVSAKPTRYTQSSIKRIRFVVASNTSCIHFVRIHLWFFFRFSFTLWLSLRKQKLIVEPVLIPCTHRDAKKGIYSLWKYVHMYVEKRRSVVSDYLQGIPKSSSFRCLPRFILVFELF